MESNPKAGPHFEGHLTSMMKKSCFPATISMTVSFSLANTLTLILVKYDSLNWDSSAATQENNAKRVN